MSPSVAIVNTGCANLASVMFAFERLGIRAAVTSEASRIIDADRVVLPGVGSASAGMRGIAQHNLTDVVANLDQPVLGICLGMQMMAQHSVEGDARCLGIFETTVQELSGDASIVLPHMGWNTVDVQHDSLLLKEVPIGSRFYFVHSFALPPTDYTTATCTYGDTFSAAIERDNFFGVQFHPERSGHAGATVLKNFVDVEL